VDLWWESTNIAHLFPVGEIAGTHGVYRPGGSALNAGQVGAQRAAMKIASDYGRPETFSDESAELAAARHSCAEVLGLADKLLATLDRPELDEAGESVSLYLRELQQRMTRYGAQVRDPASLGIVVKEGIQQLQRFPGLRCRSAVELPRALKVRQLAIAHIAYLAAIEFYVNECSGGSRGSSLVLDNSGVEVHPGLKGRYRYRKEAPGLRKYQIATRREAGGLFSSCLMECRPLPQEDFWFETVWREFRDGAYF
jgi:aspartate oxidase